MPEEDRAAIPLGLADTARALDLTLKLPKVTPGRAISFVEVTDADGLCPLCVREREIGRGDWDYPVGELPKGGASIRFRDLHYVCSNVGCPARRAQDGLAPAEWIAPLAGERALAVLEHLHEHWHESEEEMTSNVVRLDGSPVVSETDPDGTPILPTRAEVEEGAERIPPVRLSLADVLNPPRETFILGKTIPLGKSSVIFGPSGKGKSVFLSQLACALASGQEAIWGLDLLPGGGPVLVYTAEDTLDDWKRKVGAFVRAGIIDPQEVLSRLWIIDQSDGMARLQTVTERYVQGERLRGQKNTHTQDWIIQCAQEIGAKLIVVETASRLVDDEDNAAFSALQSALGRIARLTGAAVLTSHHPTKEASKSNDPAIESARGGGAFTANARNALSLFPAKKEIAAEYPAFDPDAVLTLLHGKTTSSVRKQPDLILILCDPGGDLGGVLQLPEDTTITPEMRVEGHKRAAEATNLRLGHVRELYAVVERLRQQDGTEGHPERVVTYTRLRGAVKGTNIPPGELKEIIQFGRNRGNFSGGGKRGKGGGENIVLGWDPRSGSAPPDPNAPGLE